MGLISANRSRIEGFACTAAKGEQIVYHGIRGTFYVKYTAPISTMTLCPHETIPTASFVGHYPTDIDGKHTTSGIPNIFHVYLPYRYVPGQLISGLGDIVRFLCYI